jgi:hypothetical protein
MRAYEKLNYFRVLYSIHLRAWDRRDFNYSVSNTRTHC